MTAIVTLYDDLNTWTKDVGNDTGIGDRKRLPSSIGNSKGDKLLLVVANNRASLYYPRHTDRLSSTGSTTPQFVHSHIVDGIRLCIRRNKIDHGR